MGILEQHWNGAKLIDAETMLTWSRSMTWKVSPPLITLNTTVYEKGVTLSDAEMKEVNSRLERNSSLVN
jgi:Rhodopirellula transposase DDE domain